MYFKKSILTVLFTLISTLCFSQSKLDKLKKILAEDISAKRTEIMVSKLNLNEEEKSKVHELNLKTDKNRKEIFQNSSKFKIPRKLRVENTKYEEELEKILTKEKWKLYGEKKSEIKDEMIVWVDEQEI
ncbi:hypothetical protein [Aureivirga sp. CE67]|uniref:hypothetical protein n=1 Tax=Aureivirga sp. CE67 TaxID=1788983 RepID=UPI0018C948AB|nr:hypothetical protein [Aureivirga sp. CE67]